MNITVHPVAVLEAVHALTPKAKPSAYAKRWRSYATSQNIHWRGRARTERRAGRRVLELKETAKAAAKQYHNAIRQRKKSHWDTFLKDKDNIWEAAKYLDPSVGTAFGKVPQLIRADKSRTASNEEQAAELLATFFPPLPDDIEDEGDRPERSPVPMLGLTIEEIEQQLLPAKP
ncbi:hypothetical protein TASIC1_0003072900 [Trichoderma asperellum]|uniref:Uncharacterized protein n=1 Tax=Trichoderma asperellum TaxID=101201 RepID=A0A6V8QPI1_TRIAP|nr:hypothetical protein TASIC1_0003072900 [Trichoderma asperellum]